MLTILTQIDFSAGSGCDLRLLSDVLTDFVPEVRYLVGDVVSRLFPARGCDQKPNSNADPHSDRQSNAFTQ